MRWNSCSSGQEQMTFCSRHRDISGIMASSTMGNNLGLAGETSLPGRPTRAWRGRLPLLALAVAVGVLLTGCANAGPSRGSYPLDWFTEMHYNPSFKTQEPPSLSAPSEGVPTMAGRGVEYVLDLSLPAPSEVSYTMEEARELQNPVPRSDAAVALGSRVFQVNCSMCHGAAGLGDGPMRERLAEAGYGTAPPDLTAAGPTVAKPDGEIYQVITKGFGEAYLSGRANAKDFVMPPFAKLLTSEERWALVHYIRVLQGK